MAKKKRVDMADGWDAPWWVYLSLKQSNIAVGTLLGFAIGQGSFFGATGVLILTLLRDQFQGLLREKAKNDTPPDSTTFKSTEVGPKGTTESSVTTGNE